MLNDSTLWLSSPLTLFFLIFFLFGPRFILWSHWLFLFWTSCVLPRGFQIQSGYLACTLSCLRAVNLKVTTVVTPAFSTNMGVHWISVYTAWLARLLSHALGFEPLTQWWAAQRCVTKSDVLPTELFCWPSVLELALICWCLGIMYIRRRVAYKIRTSRKIIRLLSAKIANNRNFSGNGRSWASSLPRIS